MTGWSEVLPVAVPDFGHGETGRRGSRPSGLARWAPLGGPDAARPAYPPKPWQLLYRYRVRDWYWSLSVDTLCAEDKEQGWPFGS